MPEAQTQVPEELAPGEDERNRGVVEALLITSDEPLGAAKIASVLGREVGAREVRAYVDDLNAEYISTGRSFRIAEIAGGYQLMVHPEYAPWVRQLMRDKSPARLSAAALETLAIVAFKQPITKAEMEHIRGVAVDGVVRNLLEKSLVRISGRADGLGRPLLYGTTRQFLVHFGLRTLSDLPKLRELDDLLKEHEQRQGGGRAPEDPESEGGPTGGGGQAVPGDGGDRPAEEGSAPLSASAGAAPQETDGEDGGAGTPQSVPGPGGGSVQAGERPVDSGEPGSG